MPNDRRDNSAILEKIEGTNNLINEKFETLKESNTKDHNQINNHLAELNCKVAKNSGYITKAKIYIGIIIFINTAVIIPVMIGLVYKYMESVLFK